MRYEALFPAMGPHPLEDTFGMAAAVAMLDRSLDPGRYEEHVQFETFRKLRSAFTNLYQASVEGLKDRVGAYEKNKTWFSLSPTMGFGFTQFMEGIHRRVGDLVKRDESITIELLKAVLDHLEVEWNKVMRRHHQFRNHTRLRTIALLGFWYCAGFCCGFR